MVLPILISVAVTPGVSAAVGRARREDARQNRGGRGSLPISCSFLPVVPDPALSDRAGRVAKMWRASRDGARAHECQPGWGVRSGSAASRRRAFSATITGVSPGL